MDIFRGLGGVALLGLIISVGPPVAGLAYALRPSERRLAMMRPISLASIFAGLATLSSGISNALRSVAKTGAMTPELLARLEYGMAEATIPLFVAFGFLTVAWLAVAFGMRRESAPTRV